MLIVGFVSAACADPALLVEKAAAADKPRQEVVTQYTGEILLRAQEAMEVDRYERALADMNGLLKQGLKPFDRAKALELRGYTFAALDDYNQSVEDWEASAETGALPEATILDMHYRLAQVYAALEQYPSALQNLEKWFARAENPGAEALFLAAQLYYVADRPKDALSYVERGLAKMTEPRQSWYEISVAIYYENNLYTKAVPLLEQMVVLWPDRKTYHTQLAGFYFELDRELDHFKILERAYQKGLVDQSGELVRLAQLYRMHKEPGKAAELLEAEMAHGLVKSTNANRRELAYAWMEAGEQEKAAAVLRAPDHLWRSPPTEGESHFLRCEMLYAAKNWVGVVQSCLTAVVLGGLDKRDTSFAWFYLGRGQTELGQIDDALNSLQKCMNYDDTQIECAKWTERATKKMEAPLVPIRWQAPDFWRVEAQDFPVTELRL